MKDITHIERACLPWRDERATECGLDATRHPTWSREEAWAKLKELGEQRFSLFVCMTCSDTARRHATWEMDPTSCLRRYTEKMGYHWTADSEEKRQFNYELRAIAMLIEAHRDEYDRAVRDLSEAVDLSVRRMAANLKRGRWS